MYGAILGDIIGSPYEFDMGKKSKNFPLFCDRSFFTDDTVMTVAVCEGLMNAGKNAEPDVIRYEVIDSMRVWGKRYPHAGYGIGFQNWLECEYPSPYNSYGNGSAMRVSAVGWLYDTLDRTREVARATADVTHNHPEGIKGAEAVASVIYLARTGARKEEIIEYVENEFQYNLSRTVDEIRPDYHHVETCQQTVPVAILAFIEGYDFEDVVRTAVSLGGDCDTLTDIAAAMAEAMYDIPVELQKEVQSRIPNDMQEVLEQFVKIRLKRVSTESKETDQNPTYPEHYTRDQILYSGISLHSDDAEKLASQFLIFAKNKKLSTKTDKLESTEVPLERSILAIHYADAGAQGYPGDVRILYDNGCNIRILSGNYAYGSLNLEDLTHKFPILSCFTETEYQHGKPYSLFPKVPHGWKYLYMGALNHLIIRDEIWELAKEFLDSVLRIGGHTYQLFDAVYWFCNAKEYLH